MAEPNASPTRTELRNEVTSWMTDVSDRMGQLSAADQAELKPAFTRIATDALKLVGDERGAELASQPSRTEIYRAATDRDGQHSAEAPTISREDRDTLVKSLARDAEGIGLRPEDLQQRLSRGAANALEERAWIRADVTSAAKTNGFNFENPEERTKAAELVDRFYDKAAGLIAAHGRDVEAPGDRLRRALTDMAKIGEHGTAAFDNPASARAFSDDMKARYGEAVMEDLAAGKTDRLASDFADPGERRQIARAVVAAGAVHEEIGLPRREADRDAQTDPREAAILRGIEAEVKHLRSEGYSRAYISERSAEIEKTVELRIDRDARAKDRDQDRER